MNIIAIAAVDKNWAIGNKGKLLVSIPDDMKFFRETTTHHTVVMGRRTLQSFPNGKPLPNRTNVVLTANPDFRMDGAVVLHGVDEFSDYLKMLRQEENETEVYIIGGGSVYRELLPFCDTALITKIDYAYEADTYFPNLDVDPAWQLVEEGEEETYFDLCFQFDVYHRIG